MQRKFLNHMEGNTNLKRMIHDFWTRYPCAKNLITRGEAGKEFFLVHDRIIDRLTPYHPRVFQYESARNKRVLEIGCGMGGHAWRFAKHAKELYAIDLSTANVELTKRRLELYNIKGANIQEGDAEKLDFSDNFFDYIYSNGVIHHTPDTDKAAQEIYRVLKPGGTATIMIYHKNSIFRWFDLMFLGCLKYLLLKSIPQTLVRCVLGSDSSVYELKKIIDKRSWKSIPDLVLCHSDGHFNPHTKVYTIAESKKLFFRFREIKTELLSSSDRLLEKIPWVNRHFGWCLFIFLKK